MSNVTETLMSKANYDFGKQVSVFLINSLNSIFLTEVTRDFVFKLHVVGQILLRKEAEFLHHSQDQKNISQHSKYAL